MLYKQATTPDLNDNFKTCFNFAKKGQQVFRVDVA